MIVLALSVWFLAVVTLLIGYGVGRASLTLVEKDEDQDENPIQY